MSEHDLRTLLRSITQPYRLVGDDRVVVSKIKPLAEAKKNDLTFARRSRFKELSDTEAGVVITDVPIHELQQLPFFKSRTWILCDRPRLAVAEVAEHFTTGPEPRIHPTALVDPTARLGNGVAVGPFVVVGPRVEIGDDCVISSHVRIEAGTRIGDQVSIGPGTMIGTAGFGLEQTVAGWRRIPHLGGVLIRDRVEIGANCCIDRGTFGLTIIGSGTKVSNLVQIAHNVRVGSDCVITGRCMVSGSAIVEDGVWLAPGTVVSNGVRVGSGAIAGVGAVIIRDVDEGQTVAGVPARRLREDGTPSHQG